MATIINTQTIDELEAWFIGRNDAINRWGNIIASFQELPGLVGFWSMSSMQRSTGNAYDLSAQSRTLTYNGNPTYNIHNNTIPYIDFDGTGDYLSRADETDLDILGTETIYASGVRGLTMGGWFWFDGLGSAENFFSKFDPAGNQRSYLLFKDAGDLVTFAVSTNGIATVTVASSAITASTWLFIVGRFVPSTDIAVWVNDTKATNAVGTPASIFNSTAPLTIGARSDATSFMDGRTALCFLCANALDDSLVFSLFQQTRVLFGV